MSETSLKMMDTLTKELEQTNHDKTSGSRDNDFKFTNMDPLFMKNVGDFFSAMSKTNSSWWVRWGNELSRGKGKM
ncbi:unnamed protein product [Linum tenue]|uniref:Uncharacterized protein n=1 Tax=Linum tenue TaxID=586396 RepID=A0AAV0J0Q6_9ROSI|nr:unnamed protein product [Linum tenue]